MKNYRILAVLFFLLVLGTGTVAEACTSIIVSGRVTRDGRPMILKNRDSGDYDNLSMLVQGEKYKYLGIVGAADKTPVNVWVGHNEAGFAILNTAAYNLNGKDHQESDSDGMIMRRALEICATLEDFEHLLDTLPRPMDANSNFGVMDARGGCAYYETGNTSYKKFDANDPDVAPYGYLVRTNHALSGDRALDKGVERFMAISEFMTNADFTGRLDKDYLLCQIPRYLKHGFTQIDLRKQIPQSDADVTIVPFKDFIPRYQTTSTVLIQGVKPGESPLLTVSWTMVGSPLTTVAIPLCITPDGCLPGVVTRNAEGFSKLTRMGLELKKTLFPLKRGNVAEYLDLSKLINRQNTGILQRILSIEEVVLDKGNAVLEEMRAQGKFDKRMNDYYRWVDEYVAERYEALFALH